MVTEIEHRIPLHLYITEWMEELDLTDEMIADRLDSNRETIWRWRNEQHRLNPGKIARLATAMGIVPEALFRPPWRPSLDAIVSGASKEDHAEAFDIVQRLMRPKQGG